MEAPLTAKLGPVPSLCQRLAGPIDEAARWGIFLISLFVLVVIPWVFGGMGFEGLALVNWAGLACLLPLSLWVVSSILIRRNPGSGFWVACVCWGLLALQIWLSIGNPSQEAIPPWHLERYGPLHYNSWLPDTAFQYGTQHTARLWLSYALLALSTYVLGVGKKQWRVLLWALVVNVSLLAVLGIPYKYSGSYLMLGRWRMGESYFYSTFVYHNHWCAYALLGLAGAMGLFVEQGGKWLKAGLVLSGAVIFASALISVSRLGTLVMALFLSFAVFLLMRGQLKSGMHSIRRVGGFGLLALCVFAATLGGALLLKSKGGASVGQRTWSYILTKNPFGSRINLVEDAVPMVQAKPLYGWGLGAFGVSFRAFQRPETIIVYNQGRVTRYTHCHNDWMEWLVELGWVGMSLYLVPLGVWLRLAGRSAMSDSRFWLRIGLLALALFALGDMAFVNRSVASSTVLLLGLVCSRASDGASSVGSRSLGKVTVSG